MAIGKKVYTYLLEIITIFIGITLSFAFEDYRQHRNERNNRKEIIQSLVIDIDFKKREIREDIAAFEWQYKTIDSCLMFAKKGQPAPKYMIVDLYSLLSADFAYFEPTTPSFSSLTSTGIWQQLPDSLRREIYNSYNLNFILLSKMYQKASEYSSYVQEHYLVKQSLMQPYEEEPYYDLTNQALANPEFRSALLLFRNQNRNTISRLNEVSKGLDHLGKSLRAYNE